MTRRSVRTIDDFAAWAAVHARGLAFAGPDPHYAIGLENLVPGYRVASLTAPPALGILAAQGIDVFALADTADADADVDAEPSTVTLLSDPATAAFIDAGPHRTGSTGAPRLMIFKSSHALEVLCRERGWDLLCAPAIVARRWENKITFRELAGDLGLPQPPGLAIDDLAEATYAAVAGRLGPRFVLQAAHGFSGARTFLATDAETFDVAVRAIRARRARATAFVDGVPLTLNACVTSRGVAVGAPCVQITGDSRLTRYPLGSCGNDWTAAREIDLDPAPFVDIARPVGEALAREGYGGVFGLDFVRGEDGRLWVIEVNSRLVASIALFTQLELAAGRLPLLARHVMAFVDPEADDAPLDVHLEPVDGSQVILHNVSDEARRIERQADTGVYRIDPASGSLSYSRPAVRVEAAHGPGEMLVLAPQAGRVVGAGQAWGRIQMRGRAVDGDGRLLPALVAAIADVARAAGMD